MIEGIDISAAQQPANMNWPAIKEAGIKFVIGKSHEGGKYLDTRFKEHAAAVKEVELLFGSYIYLWASLVPRTDVLELWAQTLADAEVSFVALDVEIPSPGMSHQEYDFWWVRGVDGGKDVLNYKNQPTIQARVIRTVELIEEYVGKRVLLYTGKPAWDFLKLAETSIGDRDIWWAQYNSSKTADLAPRTPLIHQYTGTGHCEGIVGHIDRNQCDLSIEELTSWAEGTTIG